MHMNENTYTFDIGEMLHIAREFQNEKGELRFDEEGLADFAVYFTQELLNSKEEDERNMSIPLLRTLIEREDITEMSLYMYCTHCKEMRAIKAHKSISRQGRVTSIENICETCNKTVSTISYGCNDYYRDATIKLVDKGEVNE